MFYKLSELRNKFKDYYDAEELARKNKNPSTEFNFKHVGILKVFDNNNINILDIPLLVGIGTLNANDDYFCAIKFKDGVIAIQIPQDALSIKENVLLAILSHEIGHVLNNDLIDKNRGILKFIDRNKRKQKFYTDKYLSEKEDSELDKILICYERSVFFGLLRGGCIELELEADTTALQIVDKESLIESHKFHDERNIHINPNTILEINNRIKRLNEIKEPIKKKYYFVISLFNE